MVNNLPSIGSISTVFNAYDYKRTILTGGKVSWNELIKAGESVQHSGEYYRQAVEEYLESTGEFKRTGDPYSGPVDISFTRPAHNEEKVFHVETKKTKVSLVNDTFITTLARIILLHANGDDEFEYSIFAPAYANETRWRHIFDGRRRKDEEVERYWKQIQERHNLDEDEARNFNELDLDDFRSFIGIVDVNEAPSNRVRQLTEQNRGDERPEKTYDFYLQEHEPVPQETVYLSNVFETVEYPDYIWVIPSKVDNHSTAFNQIPRETPIWFEGSDAYSLLSPEELPEKTGSVAELQNTEQCDFRSLAFDTGDDDSPERRLLTTLLNKRLLWRGTQLHDRCKAVYHDNNWKLIITLEEDELFQTSLSGEIIEPDNAQIEKYEGYNITRNMGLGIGHRYGRPQFKWYDDRPYLVIDTGWLFTKNGKGNLIRDGQTATELHHNLKQQRYFRTTNERALFRQWRQYLRVGSQHQLTEMEASRLNRNQYLTFREPDGFELRVRPPEDSDEQEAIMEGQYP